MEISVKTITLSRNQLKIIAAATMLADHIGCIFLQGNVQKAITLGFRGIGRLSFVIFSYLVVQGFFETGDYKKYVIRMFFYALLSEIPYDAAFGDGIFDFRMQNVLFTYLLGLFLLKLFQKYETNPFLSFGLFALFCLAARLLNTDYAVLGMLLVTVFYFGRYNKTVMWLFAVCALLLQGGLQMFGAFAIPLCMLYDKEKKQKIYFGRFFYRFYPVHLLVLAIIANILQVA